MKRHLVAIVAAFLGGVCGTGSRFLLDTVIPHTDSEFPFSTLLVNVVGAFLLGLVVARLWSRFPDWIRVAIGTGFLGSFTTFSAVMVSLVAQTAAGQWWMVIVYLLVSLILGFTAAALGLRVGRVSTPIDWVDE